MTRCASHCNPDCASRISITCCCPLHLGGWSNTSPQARDSSRFLVESRARHQRRSVRLREYDYAQPGAYFVTIITQRRERIFGDIVDGRMNLNGAGEMGRAIWEALPQRFPPIEMGTLTVLPNHIFMELL